MTGTRTETPVTRRLRAVAFVLLLLGSLLPSIGGVSLAAPAIALAAPLILFELQRVLPRIHPTLKIVVPLFAVLAAPGLPNPPTTAYGHDKLMRLVTFTLLSACAPALIRGPRTLVSVAKVWVLVATGLAAVLAFGGGTLVAGRESAFDSNPIWLSRSFASAVILLAWLTWQKHVRAWVALPAAALLVVGLFLSDSRGPTLGCLIGLVALALFANRARTSRIILVFCLGLAAAAALTYSEAISSSRLGQFFSNPAGDISGSLRTEVLRRTIPVIQDNPAGVGYGNWQAASGAPTLSWPHNLFLEVLAEGGWLVGGFLVVTVLVAVVRLIRRTRRSAEAGVVLALLLAETFAVSVSGDLNARSFFAFLTLAFVVAGWPASGGEPVGGEQGADRVDGRLGAARV